MGNGVSACDSSKLANTEARVFFDKIVAVYSNLPDQYQKDKNLVRLVVSIYESMKILPDTDTSFGITITGRNAGNLFLKRLMPLLHTLPDNLTKVSFRGSDLSEESIPYLIHFILNTPHLEQLDLSENNLGHQSKTVFEIITAHEHLTSLIMEECHIDDTATKAIINLLSNNTILQTFRLESTNLCKESINEVFKALKNNKSITVATLGDSLLVEVNEVTERNKYAKTLTDQICMSPFKRNFANKMNAYKSIKGREMLAGRARQKEESRKANPDMFQKLETTDERARQIDTIETAASLQRFRSGKAEMIGRRPNMEDVSIIVDKCPSEKGIMYGIFDGHGGREAAEFAGEHLPKNIADRYSRQPLDEALINSFKFLQIDMKNWCVYVGCTACLAMIEGRNLTVANIGDTRAVLCRGGKAIRLSFDHKPGLPEETAYIQSKGSFVRDGRVGGMLAVSRAFGDGFLGDAVNPTPYISHIELTNEDLFLIIACDGVWDVIMDQEACDLIMPEVDPLTAAMKLRDAAYDKDSQDNISVIVVNLKDTLLKESEAEAQ